MASKKMDSRVRRSRGRIQGALLQALSEKPYDKISVIELVERSGVSRPTFYFHYESKDDLLIATLDDIFDQLDMEDGMMLQESHQERGYHLALGWFTQMEQHPTFFRLLLYSPDEQGLRFQYTHRVRQLLGKILAKPPPTDQLNQLTYYVASVALGLTDGWLKGDLQLGAEQLAQLFVNLVTPGINNVLGGLD